MRRGTLALMKRSLIQFLLAVTALSRPAAALTINLTYDTNGVAGSVPGTDSDGARLMALAQAAADYWEDIIRDAHTLDLTIRYENGLPPGLIGLWTIGTESGGRADTGTIGIRGLTTWFYDTTPAVHSEFAMTQTLFRNAGGAEAGNFTGTVPGTLEINFMGLANPGAPAAAQTGSDLYSVLLHEMGHALGMSVQLSTCATEVQDNDFDINPALANGNSFAVVMGGTTGAHTACTQCLMNPGIGTGRRRLPSATDVLALATCPNPGWSQIDLPRRDFLQGGTQDWNTAANWVGNRVPNSTDDAAVRHGLDVAGDPLVSLSGPASCRSLQLTGETRLRTLSNKLDVALTATLDYDGNLPAPEIFVESGGELEATDVTVNGGEIDMTGGLLDVADDLLLSDNTPGRLGILTGYGAVEVDGTLRNDGRIDGADGQTLTFNSPALAPWDLDGASGNGEVLALLGSLNFATGAMSDAFDGLLQIEDPWTVTFGDPWALGAGGLVKLNGGDGSLATLVGALFEAATGDIQVTGDARITAPLLWSGSLEFITAADAHLRLDGLTTITGGAYLLGANAVLECNNSTSISGGAFIIPGGAVLRLDATHTLSGGAFNGAGTLAFNGSQTTVDSAVTVNCGILDFDGPGGAKIVQLNAPLTVNSDQLDQLDSKFDATLNIAAAPAALHINGPASWIMSGILNHTTGSNVFNTSLSGAPVTVSGAVNVSGSTRWDARATISGSIVLGAGSSRLQLNGGTEETPNRLQGGSATGNGSLRAQGAHLAGFGSIQCGIDFLTDSTLRADDGVLSVSGPFVSMPPVIGTADADGILEVVNPWTLPAGKVLSLQGGIARGATVTLQGHLSGHGTLQSSNVINNGAITATDGQTLVIDTTGGPDLDGLGTAVEVSGHLLEAVQGDLHVVKAPGDAIGATVVIGPGRTATFQNGWTLDTTGALQMSGGTLAGGTSLLRGSLTVEGVNQLAAPAQFESGSTTVLAAAGDVLRLQANSTIHSGAVFQGAGLVTANAGMTLTLAHLADVGVALTNAGSVLPAAGPGQATLASFTQTAAGSLTVDILGLPGGSDYDHLTVTGAATLDGALHVSFNAAGATAGTTWKILSAGSISGKFSQFTAAGLLPDYQLLPLVTADGVYVKLVQVMKYGTWATAQGLTAPDDGPAADPDNDGIGNGLEMFLGGHPLKPEPHLMPHGSLVKEGGVYYLAIDLSVVLSTLPADLTLEARRSTDLVVWKQEDTVMEITGYDPALCVEVRRYRSTIPFNSLPREYLQVTATGP